ncbi:MAG: PHP domain-containing protein, partial [Acidimicrobiia bacterium]|nr:PHP domain-containing protein [Acidimicrobiia bacterium]
MTPPPAAAEHHPHLADPLEPGWVRVDMHSHTMWSGDCTTTPDELAVAVEAAQLNVLCITDHNVTAGAERLASELPCRVIIGEELRVG